MGVMDMCGALSGAFMLAGVKGSAGIEAPGTTKGADLSADPRDGERLQGEERHLPLLRAQGRRRRQCPPLLPRLHRGCVRAGREDARSVKSRTGKIKPLYLFRYSGFFMYIQSIAAPTRPASLPSEARTSSVFVSPRKVSFSMRLRSGASSFRHSLQDRRRARCTPAERY